MLSIYLSITHSQFRSSWLCLLWAALWPIKILKLFIYFDVKFDLVCLGLTCSVAYTVATHGAELNKQTADSIITFYSQSDRYQHCNFRKNTDRSSNSGSEQPQRNARHSSPYQNQVSRPVQEIWKNLNLQIGEKSFEEKMLAVTKRQNNILFCFIEKFLPQIKLGRTDS